MSLTLFNDATSSLIARSSYPEVTALQMERCARQRHISWSACISRGDRQGR
jgi:hypothetical protein